MGLKSYYFCSPNQEQRRLSNSKITAFSEDGTGSASRQSTKNIFSQMLDKRNKIRTFAVPNEGNKLKATESVSNRFQFE